MSELRTDFKDDVLDVTQNERRKYNVIHNEDGTISLEDATVYLQQGDSFGANDLNEMNRMANQMNEAAGEILTMGDEVDVLTNDINTLKDDVEPLKSDVEVLENRPTTLLCTESDLYYKEVDCDISLPSAISINYNNVDSPNAYNIWDILYHDGKIYMLSCHNANLVELHIYDGGTWSKIQVDSDTSIWTQYSKWGNLQELNGEVYFAYVKPYKYYRFCKYENGSITEISNITNTSDTRSYLVKDYENNNLYWIRTLYGSSNADNYYQKYNGKSLGSEVVWYSGPRVSMFGAYIKNNKLYIMANYGYYNSGSSSNSYTGFIEVNLTNTNATIRYMTASVKDMTSDYLMGITKKIRGEYLSIAYYNTYNFNIYRNAGTPTGLTEIICSGMAFTEYEDGVLICDVTRKIQTASYFKSLKKIKLYKKLYTYGKSGDILQCGDSFAISDNLEPIENGYRVTADGNVEIGLYL